MRCNAEGVGLFHLPVAKYKVVVVFPLTTIGLLNNAYVVDTLKAVMATHEKRTVAEVEQLEDSNAVIEVLVPNVDEFGDPYTENLSVKLTMAPTTPGSNRALEDLDDQVSDPPAPGPASRRILPMRISLILSPK